VGSDFPVVLEGQILLFTALPLHLGLGFKVEPATSSFDRGIDAEPHLKRMAGRHLFATRREVALSLSLPFQLLRLPVKTSLVLLSFQVLEGFPVHIRTISLLYLIFK